MFIDMPLFMENKEWYYYDFEKKKYFLTERAPRKAKESYDEFYKELNSKREVD